MEKWLAFFLFSFPFFLERKKRDLGRWRANVSRAVWACVASCTLDISGWNGVPLFFSTRSSRGIGGGRGRRMGDWRTSQAILSFDWLMFFEDFCRRPFFGKCTAGSGAAEPLFCSCPRCFHHWSLTAYRHCAIAPTRPGSRSRQQENKKKKGAKIQRQPNRNRHRHRPARAKKIQDRPAEKTHARTERRSDRAWNRGKDGKKETRADRCTPSVFPLFFGFFPVLFNGLCFCCRAHMRPPASRCTAHILFSPLLSLSLLHGTNSLAESVCGVVGSQTTVTHLSTTKGPLSLRPRRRQ